jgi:uncharacterized protein with PQ loop repeat
MYHTCLGCKALMKQGVAKQPTRSWQENSFSQFQAPVFVLDELAYNPFMMFGLLQQFISIWHLVEANSPSKKMSSNVSFIAQFTLIFYSTN